MTTEGKRHCIILIIGFLSAVLMIFFSQLTFFLNIEHRVTDFKFSLRGVHEEELEDSRIVIVAIDDQSFAQIPYKYPWPRTYHATLVENLNRAGADTILFDVAFTEESAIDPEQDSILRGAIQKWGNVVLAGKMVIEERQGFTLVSLLPPIETLHEVAPFGITDTKFDTDGFVRRYILFRDYNEERYYSLGIATLAKHLGLKGNPAGWFQNTDNGDFLLGGKYLIKKYDDLPSAFINYYGPAYSFKTIAPAGEKHLSKQDHPHRRNS